jgi:hypothetical protein
MAMPAAVTLGDLGLVDLVEGVGHHLRGGHRFALTGERFVGLVAEDIAEVGDRGGDFRQIPGR